MMSRYTAYTQCNIDYIQKDSPAQPAPDGMYDELAGKYRAALLAIAD